jgi:hypothetical protein
MTKLIAELGKAAGSTGTCFTITPQQGRRPGKLRGEAPQPTLRMTVAGF